MENKNKELVNLIEEVWTLAIYEEDDRGVYRQCKGLLRFVWPRLAELLDKLSFQVLRDSNPVAHKE